MSENTISDQQTLFAADSLASLTVTPGSEKARQMTATSGLNIYELLKNSGRDLSLAKTFLASLLPCSTRFFLTWKISVTPAKRLLFQLSPLELSTDETEFLLWPTPAAAGWGNEGSRNMLARLVQSGAIAEEEKRRMSIGIQEKSKHSNHINPEFWEWLMGFPMGWTDLEHSETP